MGRGIRARNQAGVLEQPKAHASKFLNELNVSIGQVDEETGERHQNHDM